MEKELIFDKKKTNYVISDEGYVLSKKTKNKISVNNGNVQLYIEGKSRRLSLGRLVALSFIPNPNDYPYVTHIDGNKNNNCINNLKWISAKENARNVWDKRIENGTTNPNFKRRKNIVEDSIVFILKDNEKQIEIDGELIPYAISTEGVVRNLKTNYCLKGTILHSYHYINFRWNRKQKNKALHQLIATAFIPNPNHYTIVDHIDGNRLNNSIENLRWVSYKENNNNIHKNNTPKPPVFPEVIFTKEELENEEWKEYKDFVVSNLGRIKGKRGKILKGNKSDSGYIKYGKKHSLGHIIVWEAFCGKKKEGMVINHINGNKHDNRLSNLEEVTHQENLYKAAVQTNAWNFKKVGEFNEKGELLRTFPNASEAGRAIGILPSSMRNSIRRNGRCKNKLYYRYLDK